MMIIYTNEGNPLGLKLLVCGKYGKRDVTVKTVTLNEPSINEPKHLPILELESGSQIFCSNAAVRFMLPANDSNFELNEQWLEWSATRLAPALALNMAVGHRSDSNAKAVLNQLVEQLNDTLKKSAYLTGDKITSSDLSVWSLLTPDGTLKGARDIDRLLEWYRCIASLSEVKSALEILPQKDLHFNSLKNSNRFGGLHHIVLDPTIEPTESHLVESSNKISDTVTDEEKNVAEEFFIWREEKVTYPIKEVTVLPKADRRNILITSALPYVNNVPHLGNIIGCVLSADIFARYTRLAGYNTLYISGTDEYGTATETKALEENTTPKEICDKYYKIHDEIYKWFNISFDHFGRTSSPEQTRIVQNAFIDMEKANYLQEELVKQLLCEKCDRYLADRFVEGTCPYVGCGYEDARGDQCDRCGKLVNAIELIRPRCKQCSTAPVLRESSQFFLNLPKIEPQLREWLPKVERGWTHNARVITKAWLKEGLKPRCITRDLKWGIPVPYKNFENKVFYVWFDAPFGYVSMTNQYTDEWQQWWQPHPNIKVEYYQFMAKDNVPFHSVMFPSILLALNQGHITVSNIMATEYLNYEDGKFSKSRGIGVFGDNAQESGIPSDVWRFYLVSARPEGQDSSFSWNDLLARNNSELLNNLGNFVNRGLVFCEKNYNSTVPEINLMDDDRALLSLVNREILGYCDSLENCRLRDGIRHILSISRHGNQYLQSQQPWVLFKGSANEKTRASTVVGICCNLSCLLGNLIFPYMPNTSDAIMEQLNTKRNIFLPSLPKIQLYLKSGHRIGKPIPLFAKIEEHQVVEFKKLYGGRQEPQKQLNGQMDEPEPEKYRTINEVEKAIAVQGDKVRALKLSGVGKSALQPEIQTLLALKKQLTELQVVSNPIDDKKSEKTLHLEKALLEDQIVKQGVKVRELKASNNKSVWQPEVNKLLALKKELGTMSGSIQQTATISAGSGKEKKKK